MKVYSYNTNYPINNIIMYEKDIDIDIDKDIPLKTNYDDTKKNIFPIKYVYKHNWLKEGYKTTYKKDFTKHNKSENNISLPPIKKEKKHNMVGKVYPTRDISRFNIYTMDFENWNCPYKINNYS